MGLLDDAKSSVSKWFEEQVAKNKAFKAAGGMGKSNPAMTRSMGLLPATGLLEQEGDAAARADAAYGALRKEYGPLGLRPGDFVPFASGGLAIDDARLAAAKGNYGQAAGSLAGVIPVGRLASNVIRGITRGRSAGDIGGVLNIDKPSYQGEHRAPDKDSGAPLSNLAKGVYPEDVYTHGAQYYGSGQRGEAETFALARQLRGKPESKVTVYRAVPFEKTRDEQIAGLERDMADYMRRKKIPASYSGEGNYYDWASAERQRLQSLPDGADKKPYPINAGDWVTTSKDYAKEHGLGALGGNFKIVKKTVPAGQLYTSGDSILEFGYDPTGLGIQGGTGSGTNTQNINRFETEADRRMAAAQRNAALPFEQGGLGLPAGNTPMQRAKAMGFNTARGKELYHSTRGDLSSGVIDPAKSDLGFHVGTLEQADNRAKAMGAGGVNYADEANIIPLMSSKYANMLRVKDEGSFHADALAPQLEKKGLLAKGKGKQIASAIDTDWKEKGRYDQQMRDVLAQNDYDGVSYKNQQEGDGTSYAFTNPSQLRSRFAAFDPMRRNESDLLALNGQKTGSGLLNPEITKATNRGLYRTMLDDEEDKPSFPYGLIGK